MITDTKREIPKVKSRPVVGLLSEFRKDRLGLFRNLFEEYGDIVQFKIANHDMLLLTNPDHIKHVLQENYKNYKKDYFYEELKLILGEGLVTSEGEFWRRQRKLAQPAFHKQELMTFADIMTQQSERIADRWSELSEVEIAGEMKKLTISIVGLTLFQVDVSDETDELGAAINHTLEFLNHRLELFIRPSVNIPLPNNIRFKKQFKIVQDVVMEMIRKRRNESNGQMDLMTMLLNAQDEETGLGMSDRHLFDEVMTLFMAGHETTAHTLVWTWYLLFQNPNVEKKLHNELDEVLNGRTPSMDDIPKLPYTTKVIKESMRLLPAVWGIGREAINDDEMDEYYIPAGMTIMIPIYLMHTHPDYWDNPDEFNPDRFASDNVPDRWVYMPFAGGPRKCIGNNFAMMEAQLALATLAQKYSLKLRSDQKVEFDPGVTLRPKSDLIMEITRR